MTTDTLPSAEELLAYPLHTITEMHGFPGLHDRFVAEVALLPEVGQDMVMRAAGLALELHRDDKRDREPYVNHIMRVATRGMSINHFGIKDPPFITGLLLHDTVEDHARELGGVNPEDQEGALTTIDELFGQDVEGLVRALTNPIASKGDRLRAYQEHVMDLMNNGEWRPVIGKLSDLFDNPLSLPYGRRERKVRAARRYAPVWVNVEEAVERSSLPLTPEAREYARNNARKGRAIMTAILRSNDQDPDAFFNKYR